MKNEGMNEITIELGKVNANFNLRIRGTDHVELRTWNSAHPPHHAEVVFYSVDPKQVLEQFIEFLKQYVKVEGTAKDQQSDLITDALRELGHRICPHCERGIGIEDYLTKEDIENWLKERK